jgi:hypothetical protein
VVDAQPQTMHQLLSTQNPTEPHLQEPLLQRLGRWKAWGERVACARQEEARGGWQGGGKAGGR